MKVNSNTQILNPLTNEPINTAEGALTLKTIALVCLNQPVAQDARNGRSPRQVAELRMDILRRMQSAEVDLLPEHQDELLEAVAAIQPPTIYEGVREVFERAKKSEADTAQKAEAAAGGDA